MVLNACWYQMILNYPIASLFTVPQIKITPYLQGYMTLFMVLECVQVEEGFAAGGAHQPHSQVHLVHMHTDGGTWGWWTLSAALNLASIYPLDVPSWMQRGCIWAGIASSEAENAAGGADSIACLAGSETSGPVDSWGGRWGTVVDRVWQTFLWGGEAEDVEGCDTTPLKSL